MGSFITEGADLPAGTITTRTNAVSLPANSTRFGAEEANEVIARLDAAHAALVDVRDHTSGWVNVKSYGAKGDGTTDDTAALNAALAAVSSAQGKVYLGAGNYKITGPVVVPLGVSIEANGPTYGSVLYLSGASASLTFLGAGFSGGWSFRQYVRNVMIRHAPGSAAPTSGKLIEMVNAYNVEFHDVYVADVPSSTAAFDVTDCNDIILQNVVVRGEDGANSNYGLKVHGESTVKLISPDFEALYMGAQNLDSGTLDIFSPYMERNIVGVDNSAGATGQVNIYGGYIVAANDSCWPVRSFVSGCVTNIFGTRLANGGGTNTFYRAAGSSGFFYDYGQKRLHLGSPAAAGQAAPPYELTLNEGGQQGTEYGLGLGKFAMHIGGVSTFPDDLAITYTGTGDKTFHVFGAGSALMHVHADGQITSDYGFAVGSVTTGPRLLGGSGTPEGAVVAPQGSAYLRSDGDASTTLYLKTTASGNTGWVAK